MTLTLEAPPTADAPPVRRDDRPAAAQVVDVLDVVDLWGVQSFPASDPPANW
jgi:hypothetical protein